MQASAKERRAIRVCVAFFLLLIAASARGAGTTVTSFQIGGVLADPRIPFDVRIACAPGPPPHDLNAVHGHSGHPDSCWLTAFDLTIDGKSIHVPPTAYSDLSNPHLVGSFSILLYAAEITIRFKGGDGEAAYDVRFVFSNAALLRRELSEFDEDGDWVEVSQQFR